jgi:hypothetical protein
MLLVCFRPLRSSVCWLYSALSVSSHVLFLECVCRSLCSFNLTLFFAIPKFFLCIIAVKLPFPYFHLLHFVLIFKNNYTSILIKIGLPVLTVVDCTAVICRADRMLDELQLSISPQRKAGTSASRIEGSAGSVGAKDTSSSYSVTSGSHHQSSRQTVSSSNTSQHQEHHRTTPSSARRVFDTSSIASNHSLDQGASPASIRAARSQSPEQHIPQTGSYNVSRSSTKLKTESKLMDWLEI